MCVHGAAAVIAIAVAVAAAVALWHFFVFYSTLSFGAASMAVCARAGVLSVCVCALLFLSAHCARVCV